MKEDDFTNRICLRLLDGENKLCDYSILVLMDPPSNKEMFIRIKTKVDYTIFTENSLENLNLECNLL